MSGSKSIFPAEETRLEQALSNQNNAWKQKAKRKFSLDGFQLEDLIDSKGILYFNFNFTFHIFKNYFLQIDL